MQISTDELVKSDPADAMHASGNAYAPLKGLMLDLLSYAPYYDRYLCESLRQAGVEIRLAAVSPYEDPEYFDRHDCRTDTVLIDVVAPLGIRSAKVRRLLMAFEAVLNLVSLGVRCGRGNTDVLHVQWMPLLRWVPFELWFVALIRRKGVKVVYTAHNILPHDTGEKYKRLFAKTYKCMDGIICHDDHAKQELVRQFEIHPKRIWTIPHGPLFHDRPKPDNNSCRRRLRFSDSDCVMLCQGMIRPYKGLDFLLKAWEGVQAQCRNARLVIAGTGDNELMEEIRAEANRRNLEKSVYLDLRFIPDEELHEYNSTADVLLYPYKSISTSGALMTGIAYAKAIVATNLPGFRSVVEHGRTALLVEYGDAEGLTKCLVELAESQGLRQSLADNVATMDRSGRSWETIAKMTRDCYEHLMERTASPLSQCKDEAVREVSIYDRN